MDEGGVIRWPEMCGESGINNTEQDIFLEHDGLLVKNLPLCFQLTVMPLSLCAILLMTWTKAFINHLISGENKGKVLRYKPKPILFLVILLVLISVMDYVWTVNEETESYKPPYYLYIDPGLRFIMFISLAIHLYMSPPARHTLFWGLQVILNLAQVRTRIILHQEDKGSYGDQFRFMTFFVFYGLVFIGFVLDAVYDDQASQKEQGKPDEESMKEPECSEARASLFSRLTNFWILPLLTKGAKNNLTFEDLPDVSPEDKVEVLMEKFNHGWTDRLKQKKEPSLIRAVLCTSRVQFAAAFGFNVLCIIQGIVSTIILKNLMSWINSDDPHRWKGFAFGGALFVAHVIERIFRSQFKKYNEHTTCRTRMSISAAVYRKALKLSSAARQDMSIGEIVNVMSVDVHRISHMIHMVHDLLFAPIWVITTLFLMWQVVGPSCLAGLGLLIVFAPLNGGVLAKLIAKYDEEQIASKDLRIKKTSQLLAGIKVLKMYAWETTFADMVNEVRDKELSSMKKQKMGAAGLGLFFRITPFLVPICIFTAFVYSSPDNILTPEIAFVTLSLVGKLNWATGIIPMNIPFMARSIAAIRRITNMLQKGEIDPNAVELNTSKENAISIKNGTFIWNENEEEGTGPVLKDINIDIERGNLVAVVGNVGSGKSSLIASILGELEKVKGTVSVQGSIGYIPQQAWIQSTTLRNNILFGKEYSKDRYSKVISACALDTDLNILSKKDQTEIGEKGVNLSGGQKQRVSLARALYQNKDVYLLDDPLSAVDAHVGKHIFDKVLGPRGLLSKKTRVLVTHGVAFLPQCDAILVMKNGILSEVGTYYELLKADGTFAEYLRKYANTKDDEIMEQPKSLQMNRTLSRQISRQLSSISDTGSIDPDDLYSEKEEVRMGALANNESDASMAKMTSIITYFKAASVSAWLLFVLGQVGHISGDIGSSIWLGSWTDDTILNETQINNKLRVTIYALLGGVNALSILGSSLTICIVSIQASTTLHARLLNRIIRAPMSFFDATPLGRIITCFSTDFEKIDHHLPGTLCRIIRQSFNTFSTVFIIAYSAPGFILILLPILILAYIIENCLVASLCQIKRIESSRNSPIYANFDETLSGVASIRAFNAQGQSIAKNDLLMDKSFRATYSVNVGQRLIEFIIEIISSIALFAAIIYAIMIRDIMTGGVVGLLITHAVEATKKVEALVLCINEIETKIVALEQVQQYSDIEIEAPYKIEETKPISDWPDRGTIKFEGYSTRYSDELPLVIKGIDVTINAGEKMGLVGRTGAGKSSVMSALFRILEAIDGRILVDDIDISKIGLHDLRSRIMTIPQDPVLFSGSLRSNLDPFNKHTNEQLWVALKMAHLGEFVSTLPTGLEHEVGEGGEALSVGQRQLVCLARALLRKSKILVLDEATAAVDLKTDDLIQATIRSSFSNCTVLTIAHRLNTIMDYDRIIVLDQGKIIECRNPQELLDDKTSVFYSMAKDANIV